MATWSWTGLGTHWQITSDRTITAQLASILQQQAEQFEQRYSRFIPTSLISQLNQGQKITQPSELKAMFKLGSRLNTITSGKFDLKVGRTLGELGYGQGPQNFDLGSLGKGWLMDLLADTLHQYNHSFFLINAGGDILATSKPNNQPWKVGLEHPTNDQQVIGTIELKNKALAASGANKRRWDKHHHLIDATTNQPTQGNRAVYITASQARIADAVATACFVSDPLVWPKLAAQFACDYLIIDHQGIHQTTKFAGKLFS